LKANSVLELEDTDSDSTEDLSFGLPLAQAVVQVEDDIGVQTDEDWDKPAPEVNAPTPPSINTIHDPFNSSLHFGDDENPWIT
jgi:hypothetical protein